MTGYFSGLLHVEQVQDYAKLLMMKNESQSKLLKEMKLQTTDATLLSLKSTAAMYILNLCDYWKFSAEVKFLAIEMYHEFICNLLNDIFKTIFKKAKKIQPKICVTKKGIDSSEKSSLQDNQWSDTLQHIIGQMELRAVSCVTISSKLSSNCLHVTNDMAIKFLALGGHKYNADTLLKSEVRILKTLKFSVGALPLVLPYVCTFADLISSKNKCYISKEVFDSAISLLSCFYTCSDKVYERYLIDVVKKEFSESELNLQLSLLSKDLVLLSCGVIASASFVCRKQNSDVVIKALSEISSLSQNTIAKFSFVLLEETLQ